jgi:threonine/homoserine/homoserine lactone efflux protein
MDIIIKGIISGIVLALLIGPVFFTILQTSIERGFWSGVLVAIGVALSDTMYIILSYLGLSQLFTSQSAQMYLGYIGGAILLCFGVYYLLIKSKRMMNFTLEHIETRSPYRLMAKGFIINGLSPMVLIFWIGTVGIATSELGYTSTVKAFMFFGAIVITVFITDILKAKLADKLRTLLTPRLIHLLNIVLGCVLTFFGGRLIFLAIQLHIP